MVRVYNQATPLKEVLDMYSEEEEGKKVKCAGRIMTMRPHGKSRISPHKGVGQVNFKFI